MRLFGHGLIKNVVSELPKSKLSKAFGYALNHRQEFFNYLEDGHCSISNSLAENCIRPFVIGRKNWLFAGSPKEAAASAGIYTLIETAKTNDLVPMKYLKYIPSDMPGRTFLENPEYLDDYLPWDPMVLERCRYDNHCLLSISDWWLFFYPLSYLTLTSHE